MGSGYFSEPESADTTFAPYPYRDAADGVGDYFGAANSILIPIANALLKLPPPNATATFFFSTNQPSKDCPGCCPGSSISINGVVINNNSQSPILAGSIALYGDNGRGPTAPLGGQYVRPGDSLGIPMNFSKSQIAVIYA